MRIVQLIAFVLIAGLAACGKPKETAEPPPDLLKPWRPALNKAKNLEADLQKQAEEQRKKIDEATK
jgi:hypothetical protein